MPFDTRLKTPRDSGLLMMRARLLMHLDHVAFAHTQGGRTSGGGGGWAPGPSGFGG